MSAVINKLPSARRDLVDIFYYFVSKGTISTARRFRIQAEATVERLANMPGTGTRYKPEGPLFADVRFSPVSRFRSYVIFYRAIPGGIEVLRVLHGVRDINALLARQLGIGATDDEDADEGEGHH